MFQIIEIRILKEHVQTLIILLHSFIDHHHHRNCFNLKMITIKWATGIHPLAIHQIFHVRVDTFTILTIFTIAIAIRFNVQTDCIF